MKRIIILAALTLGLCAPSLLAAQDYNHAEVGVFADYLRMYNITPQINFVGLGGRVGFNISHHTVLEAEMSYDFKRNYTTVFNNGVTTSFVTSSVRPLDALFGPKFETPGPFKFFVTGKVGLINFSSTTQSAPAGFTSAVNGIPNGDTRFAAYPGAGIEGFWGPIGLRLDAGDEIYLSNGTHNNLKVEFGPVFRF